MNVYFYIEILNGITISVIIANFLVNIVDFKYNKNIFPFVFFLINNLISLLNLYFIQFLNTEFLQGLVLKLFINSVIWISVIYKVSVYNFKETVLSYLYLLLMAYSTEAIGFLFVNYQISDLTLFIQNSNRMFLSVIGNVLACVVSMFYLLIYFKRKNKIENNYIFLVLLLPAVQFFILNRYIIFLKKDITIEILLVGTIFFVLQIFINIIVLNLVMKSILYNDLKKKVFLADLENEKNRYIRDLYTKQKMDFNKLICEFKLILENILNSEYKVKKNRFEDKNIFNQELGCTIAEADNLNSKIVSILDRYKENINNL